MVTGQINTTKTFEKKQAQPASFVMVKNVVGALAVKLDPYDFMAPARMVRFRFDEERQYVPLKWAIGVFVSNDALKQMEHGYFTFENLKELINLAEEMGHFVPDPIKSPKISLKDMQKALLGSDMKELERIIMIMNSKIRKDLIALAKKLYNRLSVKVVQYLEKNLAVSLQTVVLDE